MSALKSPREIDRVFSDGRRASDPLVVILVTPTPTGRDHDGRVAFIAGRRVGGAVRRNRAKRLLRAAMRAAGGPWPGYDVLLLAREETLAHSSDEVALAVGSAVKRAGVPG